MKEEKDLTEEEKVAEEENQEAQAVVDIAKELKGILSDARYSRMQELLDDLVITQDGVLSALTRELVGVYGSAKADEVHKKILKQEALVRALKLIIEIPVDVQGAVEGAKEFLKS